MAVIGTSTWRPATAAAIVVGEPALAASRRVVGRRLGKILQSVVRGKCTFYSEQKTKSVCSYFSVSWEPVARLVLCVKQ